jgi:hypothetical protein
LVTVFAQVIAEESSAVFAVPQVPAGAHWRATTSAPQSQFRPGQDCVAFAQVRR